MKVGDYVRTEYGIAKIKEYESKENDDSCYYLDNNILDDDEYLGHCLYDYKYYLKQVIKSSPNIIDLIEVGDIITFKDDEDVYKVIGRPDKECALEVFYLAKKYDGNIEDIMVYPDEMKKYIKSIVTKEQFESMEYKIGE